MNSCFDKMSHLSRSRSVQNEREYNDAVDRESISQWYFQKCKYQKKSYCVNFL